MNYSHLTKGTMTAAILAAVAGSLCCIGPLVLITLGLGGAWIGVLGKFQVIHPYAIIATALFLGFAFWLLYIKPQPCKDARKNCSIPKSLQLQRIVFWVVLVIAVLLLAFPYYGQWLV